MAIAAAFLAAGRGTVLEIQARITKPEAKPTGGRQCCFLPPPAGGPKRRTGKGDSGLTRHEKHGNITRRRGSSGDGDDVPHDARQRGTKVVEEALARAVGVPRVGERDEQRKDPRGRRQEESGGRVVAEGLGDGGEEEDELGVLVVALLGIVGGW